MGLTLKDSFNTVFDSQRIFRIILDSMARPGKINCLPQIHLLDGEYNFPFLIARTLLDSEVGFACLDKEETLGQRIRDATGARPVDVSSAEFVFCDGRKRQEDLYRTNPGTLLFPDKGATVVMTVGRLGLQRPEEGVEDLKEVELEGPGICGKKKVWISGIHEYNLKWLLLQNKEYPKGVDAILLDLDGRILCLPRSTKITRRVEGYGLCGG